MEFLKHLKIYRQYLTKQQIDTLKGQALKDSTAANKGLAIILKRQGLNISLGQ